jgi:hypothetical protein
MPIVDEMLGSWRSGTRDGSEDTKNVLLVELESQILPTKRVATTTKRCRRTSPSLGIL